MSNARAIRIRIGSEALLKTGALVNKAKMRQNGQKKVSIHSSSWCDVKLSIRVQVMAEGMAANKRCM